MDQVKLITREGGFVADVTIPTFNPRAEGLMWGSRFFVYQETILAEKPYLQYREGLLFYVPQPTETSESLTKIARESFKKATGG